MKQNDNYPITFYDYLNIDIPYEETLQTIKRIKGKQISLKQKMKKIINETSKTNNTKLQISAVISGPPCSGKGTITNLLKAINSNYTVLSPGDIYRKLREEDTPLGHQVKESLKDGGYCPSELTNKIISTEVKNIYKLNPNALILLDGYPRTEEQFQHLKTHFNTKTYIVCDSTLDVLAKASSARRICKICNKNYSLNCLETHCKCHAPEEGIVRWDDDAEMYQKRYYSAYVPLTQPIVEQIKKYPSCIYLDVHSHPYSYWEKEIYKISEQIS